MQQLFSWQGHCIENCNLTELYRTSQPFDSVRTTFPAVQDLSLSISAFGKRAHWAKALDLLFTSFQRGVEVNVIVLNSAVSACQRAHQWRFALVLVAEAGIHWKGIDPDIISYNSIVAGVAAKGHWEVALAVLSLAEESTLQLDERSYTNLLQACAPSCWDVSLWILQDMLEDRVEIDAFACAAAVSTCAESKNWELALHFLASVLKCWQTEKRAGNEDRGDWQVPMATAISVCGSVGEWMVALSLLESLQNVSTTPNIVTFGTAMKCLEQSGSWPKVLEIWTWMRNLRVAPNVYTYSMLMSSLESAGMWSRVCSTFSAMKESHVSPTSISYDILLRSCRDHIGWQFAIQILDSMRAVKVQPTVKTLNACLSILEADETQDAWCLSLGMLESMGSMSLRPDIASYSIVANTCVRSGDWQVSLILLDKMSSSLLELDAISLSISLLACEKGSQWPEAFTTLQDMHLKQVELSEISVSSVLRACQSRGCWEAALSILCTASSWRVPLGTGTCNPVLGACCSSQSWERALSLFATASSSGFRPDVVSLTTLMSACEAGFQWESALCLLFSFQDRAVQLDSTACNVGISSCASLLNWRVASALLHCDSLKQSLSASGDWPDLIAYNTVLGSCTQLESWQFALLLFQQLQIFAKLEPDTTTFHAILEACAVGQAWECALSILKDMTGFSFPFGIARNLAASACQAANRIHEARQLLVQNLHETNETAESAADAVTFKAILDLSECSDPALLSQAPGCLEALAFRARGNLVGAEGLNVIPGMLGPAAQAVVAAEILHWHQRLGEELCQQLRLRVGTPAKQQLDRLCQRKPKESSGRLQNHILERQFGLSPALSLKLLSELFDNSLGCQLWSTSAHLNSRRVLHGMEVSLDEEPTSKNLAAWASWSLVDSGCSRSQCQGYGAAGSDQVLLPVQVQHDRSPHAERQVLLTLLRTCQNGLKTRGVSRTPFCRVQFQCSRMTSQATSVSAWS